MWIDEEPSTVGFSSPPPHHPIPTNRVIQKDQDIHVHFRWNVSGLLHQLLVGSCEWIGNVYLERMGPGEGPAVPSQTVSFNASGAYALDVQIAGNTLPVGVYRVVTTLRARHITHGIMLPVAGFEDERLIEIYEA